MGCPDSEKNSPKRKQNHDHREIGSPSGFPAFGHNSPIPIGFTLLSWVSTQQPEPFHLPKSLSLPPGTDRA
jgi:hypothetical protein